MAVNLQHGDKERAFDSKALALKSNNSAGSVKKYAMKKNDRGLQEQVMLTILKCLQLKRIRKGHGHCF